MSRYIGTSSIGSSHGRTCWQKVRHRTSTSFFRWHGRRTSSSRWCKTPIPTRTTQTSPSGCPTSNISVHENSSLYLPSRPSLILNSPRFSTTKFMRSVISFDPSLPIDNHEIPSVSYRRTETPQEIIFLQVLEFDIQEGLHGRSSTSRTNLTPWTATRRVIRGSFD